MTRFDALLRQGLMDANLVQYEQILRQAEAGEPDFSPQYRRERMRLLAAPLDWERGRRTRPRLRRSVSRGLAAAVAVLLLASAAAAVSAPFWLAFFGGLDQRQREVVDGMEIGGGKAEGTAEESLLPPPAEHDGVIVTPLRILGAKNQLYMLLEIRAPEGTVFCPEERYTLWGTLSRPQNAPQEMLGHSGSFSVLEAGTREPNVLTGVVEETASFDMSGCTYRVIGLFRRTADGESETVFQASETGTWDIPIPEELSGNQVLNLPVEGVSLTAEQGTMTLISMSVSPLGIWWKYSFDGYDLGPHVRMALRMKDGSEVEADPGQLTMGDMGSGQTGAVSFEKPVDLSQAEAVLWGGAEIPLKQPEQHEE